MSDELFEDPENPAWEPEAPDLAVEEEALRAALEADGVQLCSSCRKRPVRPRKSPTGRAPTTCQVCAAAKGRGGKKDTPPASIKINMGSNRPSRKDGDVALVEARARQVALTLATGLTLVGAKSDAAILADGAATWSRAVSGLAPYEPWLVDLCRSGDGVSGRAMAWATFGMATAGLVLPIAINHELIPAGPLTMMFESVAELARQQAEEDAAAEPAGAAA